MDEEFLDDEFEEDAGDASTDGFEQAVEQAQAEHHAAAPAVAALRNPAQLTRDPSIGAGAHAHLPNAATGKFASRRQAKRCCCGAPSSRRAPSSSRAAPWRCA